MDTVNLAERPTGYLDDVEAREDRAEEIEREVDPLLQPLLEAWEEGGQPDPIAWPDPDPAHDPYFGPGGEE
jgi:hypothetical protein